MIALALFGAGGKMGCRITDNIRDDPAYRIQYVEPSERGITRLAERGLRPTSAAKAAAAADAIVLAVPDALVGRIAQSDVAPYAQAGTLVICLDPAAPFAGALPERGDLSYFVTHPCHPPVLYEEDDAEKRSDYFGGVRARQSIVCALMQGSEADYALGEAIARAMFAPVTRAHRITVGQMALLEPVMSETVAATCLTIVREAMDEAVRRGVPAEAARDFLLGHIRINLAMFFGVIDTPLSDGARLAVERAKRQLFLPEWKRVFEPEALRESIEAITHGNG
jgi:D-apionate oxidoisomerase